MMATFAGSASRSADDRFYFRLVAAMALVLIAGFSFHLAMGRSTFASPLLWHLHGVAFMGWIAIMVTQTWLGVHGPVVVHRSLGRIAAFWVPLMIVLGIAITVATVRRGTAPFIFQPQYFLLANPLNLLGFAGLTMAAIQLRRRTDWHQRLQVGAFASILGPGFGRLLPMPLLMPFAFEAAVAAGLMFPVIAMVRERRREGAVHLAWWWVIGVNCSLLLVAALIARSPAGDALYAATVAGSPGALVPGLSFGPMPPGM